MLACGTSSSFSPLYLIPNGLDNFINELLLLLLVELLIGVHGAAGLALRSVQHVGAANLLQVEGVLRSTSGNKSNP